MLIDTNKGKVISVLFNDELLTLNNSEDWSVWLKRVRDLSSNTVKSFMKSMERFWIWSLYNPVEIDESFPSYQARYREALRFGFIICEVVQDDKFDDTIEVEIYSSPALKKITINKEIAGINSYFYYTEEHDLLYDHRFINYLYEKQKSAKSFLSSIQIKSSELATKAFGQHKKYLPPYRVPKNKQRIKYFPLELFDELLEISKPRERLIYLLCGATSARIGQALNLTLYDIDYENEEVWLIAPKSDAKDIYGNTRIVWLKEEYHIDMLDETHEHNTSDLQFKYPIPLTQSPLYWINEEKYKNLFFETLREYTSSHVYKTETVRYPKHPFLFISKTGKRVHARETLTRFKTNCRKLMQKHNNVDLSAFGLHSLRHMFGHAMAEIYARNGDDSLITITQDAMGHSSLDSTMVYFNISGETMRATMKRLTKNIHNKEHNDE